MCIGTEYFHKVYLTLGFHVTATEYKKITPEIVECVVGVVVLATLRQYSTNLPYTTTFLRSRSDLVGLGIGEASCCLRRVFLYYI